MENVTQYDRYEISLEGPSTGNPFTEVEFGCEFSIGHRVVPVRGFYDGAGCYKVRLMPGEPGEWSYRTISNDAQLDGKIGSFLVEPAPSGGPVRVVGHGFAYADGTRYVPIGTTCYAWVHQPRSLRDRTMETLASSPFTKIRMCVFPKHYRYNHNEPERFVFPGSLAEGFDLSRFDPEFFAEFEFELDRLLHLGIEADVILFHPYDRWGFQRLDEETEQRYLRYIVARLAAFRNVWWSMANEWDFMKEKSELDFDRYFRTVQAEDPYAHPRSVHNGHVFYDHSRPWVTHASIQGSNTERSSVWLAEYDKPVVIDECCYEGDIREHWGNIAGAELLRRQWTAVVHGGWPGAHGETYYNEQETLWWSKGGTLIGDAPERIAFMKRILDDAPPGELVPERPVSGLQRLAVDDEYFLYYLGFQRPSWKDIALPNGRTYEVEVIDTWEMTVTSRGRFSGETRVELPGKEYMAIRVRAVS